MLKVIRLKEPVIRLSPSTVFDEASSHRSLHEVSTWDSYSTCQIHFLEIHTYMGCLTEAQAEQLLVWELSQNMTASEETKDIYMYLWLNVLPSMVLWTAICTLQPMGTPTLFSAFQWDLTENGPYERWLRYEGITEDQLYNILWSQMLDSGLGLRHREVEAWGSTEPLPLLERLLL